MRKLNVKNKILIFLFSVIIIAIIALLISSVNFARDKKMPKYTISVGSVVFNSDTSIIDTTKQGTITQHWDGNFYYSNGISSDENLGNHSVVYDPSSEKIRLFGTVSQIFIDGTVNELKNQTDISMRGPSGFYKIADRLYLIIADEIYSQNKAIFADKYLIISLDKQGNASVLNDAINVKTINPAIFVFDNYTFDAANEVLMSQDKSVDLKAVGGSTNEYIPKEEDPEEETIDSLIEAYNLILSDFESYAESFNSSVNATNQFSNNYYLSIGNNNPNNTQSGNPSIQPAENKTEVVKRVSLRGAVAASGHIDVTYAVTDPEEKYQAVYLLVTGNIGGEQATHQILLDKYDTVYRISDLSPENEYSISLGYTEVVTEEGSSSNTLYSSIEDSINIRTLAVQAVITIQKIANGHVFFNAKMDGDYTIESGEIVLYADNNEICRIDIDINQLTSSEGFSSAISLSDGNVYSLAFDNAIRGGKLVPLNIYKKFTIGK